VYSNYIYRASFFLLWKSSQGSACENALHHIFNIKISIFERNRYFNSEKMNASAPSARAYSTLPRKFLSPCLRAATSMFASSSNNSQVSTMLSRASLGTSLVAKRSTNAPSAGTGSALRRWARGYTSQAPVRPNDFIQTRPSNLSNISLSKTLKNNRCSRKS
jgi:hypothetical protein